jgi:hypothetical protein
MERGKSVSTLAIELEIPNRDQVLGAVPPSVAARHELL